MKSVTVLIGSGLIGIAIARRVSAGRHILLADLRKENADAAAAVLRMQDSKSALRPSMHPREKQLRALHRRQHHSEM